MNESGQKQMMEAWSRRSTIFPDMVGHRSPSTTAESTSRCCLGVDGQQLASSATRTFRAHSGTKAER